MERSDVLRIVTRHPSADGEDTETLGFGRLLEQDFRIQLRIEDQLGKVLTLPFGIVDEDIVAQLRVDECRRDYWDVAVIRAG